VATEQSARDAEFSGFAGTAYRSLLRVYVRWGRASRWDSPHACARKVVVGLFATATGLAWRSAWIYGCSWPRL
jgi:hypothetical protein